MNAPNKEHIQLQNATKEIFAPTSDKLSLRIGKAQAEDWIVKERHQYSAILENSHSSKMKGVEIRN